jgi:hypothetical protein
MLVGCREPVGLPSNGSHIASVKTLNCDILDVDSTTGHVDWYQTGQINDYYLVYFDVIRRGYTDSAGLQHPRMNGFCTFEVPAFESPNMAPVCTLCYYQSAHNGSADLRVTWLDEIGAPPYDFVEVFWNAWGGTHIIGTDVAHGTDSTWYKVALSSEANEAIAGLGSQGGGIYITGWTYRGSVSGTYADVTASGANAPYIKVVYDDGE